MNPLEAKIRRLIEAEGPISVALYMALCLGDAGHGYYMRQEAFGIKGDFITAPEVSQLFGEMIGVFLALNLDDLQAGIPITLVELGPGRGTLMADVLRTLKQLRPGYFEQLEVALVETSPRLRGLQSKAIAAYKAPVFHDSIASLPTDKPLLIVGNEFLDALPVRQFVKTGKTWFERMVTVQNGKLVFTIGAAMLAPNELPRQATMAAEGAIYEIAMLRVGIIQELALRLKAQGGAALIIDYGHTKSGFGDTLQAMRAHCFVPVLADAGVVDLTSHVDFEPLQKAASAADLKTGLTTQGQFLLDLGLVQRAGALGAGKSLEFQNQVQSACERLMGPEAMGDLFKVFYFASHLPPPFENSYT